MALIGLLCYGSYLVAEVLGLSGILALFCAGITVAHTALDRLWVNKGDKGGGADGRGAGVARMWAASFIKTYGPPTLRSSTAES